METRRTKKDDWIKLPSKSRPGRFYLFNKSTGETQWIPVAQESSSPEVKTIGSKKESPPKMQMSKLRSKNPAQDRLKRLQNNLRVNQIREQPLKANASEEKNKTNVLDTKESKKRSCDMPSTSSATKINSKFNGSSPTKLSSPKKANKRPNSTLNSPPIDVELKELLTPSTKKTLRFDNLSPSASNKELNTSIDSCEYSTSVETVQKLFPKEDDTKSSRLNSIRTGIVNKIKEICKIPFTTTSKRPSFEMHKAKEQRSSSSNSINTTSFKPAKKTKNNTQRLSATLQEALTQLRAEKDSSTDNIITQQPFAAQCSTPKNLSVPTYQRGSANSRLERLRQSLQLQKPSTSATGAATLSLLFAQPTSTSTTAAENNNVKLPPAFNTNQGFSTNSVFQTINTSINDEVEAMDWQPSIKQELIEISSNDCIVSNEFQRPSKKKFGSGDERTMGDIYDTVNGNLLRVSSEKHKGSLNNNNKWQKNYYYFIVDTNVLLRDLCFIDDLSEMKLCDTKGSILYIPYCVLQELDKLKMRSGCQEGVKTLAVRAIKYLNSKFENKSNHLQAQSALEEREHLVDINSADDSIINCCLQAKEHVPNLLLLTEDINLRNKAICNNILVSTKSDLVSKHYDNNDGKEKS